MSGVLDWMVNVSIILKAFGFKVSSSLIIENITSSFSLKLQQKHYNHYTFLIVEENILHISHHMI